MTISNSTTGNAEMFQFQPHQPPKQQQQQFIILAGPHKTASTSTQLTMISLQKANLLGAFVWPKLRKNYFPKRFSSFAIGLMDREDDKRVIQKVVRWTKEFKKIWSKGQSIVIGSELLGPASLSLYGSNVLDGLKQALPTGRMNETEETTSTVVLNYRSDRLGHLLSVWGQFNFKNRKVSTKTFSDWMCSMDCSLQEPKLNMNVINTLGQAAVYREANYSIVVVDTGGVERDRLNLANVPACEVLGIACVNGVPEHMTPEPMKGNSSNQEVRLGPEGGVATSEIILQEINAILKRMDCSYEHFLVDESIHILHLSDMFSNCSKWSDKPAINEKQACSLIQNVLECGNNETSENSHDLNAHSDGLTKQMNETIEYSPIGIEDHNEHSDWFLKQTNETMEYNPIRTREYHEHGNGLNLKKVVDEMSVATGLFLLSALVLFYRRLHSVSKNHFTK